MIRAGHKRETQKVSLRPAAPQTIGMKPKLLLVTRNFPPTLGGMERLNLEMAKALTEFFQVRMVAPVGAGACAPALAVQEVALKPLRAFLWQAAGQALRIAADWRPDIVLAGSGLTAPHAWLAARRTGARSAAYVHGLDITVPHPVYRSLWLPALRRLDCVVANSAPTAALARAAGVAADRIRVVHPGVRVTEADPAARPRFRAAHQLGERPVLLSVGRLTRRKGLVPFVREVLPRIVTRHPQALLLVIGDTPRNALYAEAQSRESIQAAADAAGCGAHVRFLGTVSDEALQDAYRACDVYVFPVEAIPDDPEGFGMVALEAAAAGLATVAFAVGGVIDAVREGGSGHLVPPGDSRAFAEAVSRLIDAPMEAAGVRAFAQGLNWSAFGSLLAAGLTDRTLHTAECR